MAPLKETWPRAMWPTALAMVVLGIWQVLAGNALIDPFFFPPPLTLLGSAAQMVQDGELTTQILMTLARVGKGFLLGSVAGVACGLLMGIVPAIRFSLEPFVSALFTTPKLALFPMLMLIFGLGEIPGLLLTGAACFIVVSLHTLDAVRGVNQRYVELATNYGAGKLALFRKVYLPACLPQIYTGLRLGAGRVLTVTIAIELVTAENGLGGLIWLAWQSLTTDRLYVCVFTAAGLGMLCHFGLRLLEHRFIPWRS